jgi:putative ABC transport system permease protein
MSAWRLAWRFLRRDFASGEVRVLLAALALAVAAVTSVGFLTDRAERALALEANRLLGGDAVLRADTPLGPEWAARAAAPGLRATETRAFPSMLRAGDRLRLSEVRALGAGFPLRGEFRLAAADGASTRADSVPAPGTAWLTRAGAEALGVGVDATLKLGNSEFRLAALVAQEPDAALDYFNMAPRVFIALEDLAATGLVQEGSRVAYRLVVAGEPAAVEGFVAQARAALGRGQRLETVADARPEIRSALDRAGRFLGLAALIAVVLAAVAVALAARRHAARHLDGCAMLRCLGADQRTISLTYGLELLGLGLLGGALGALLGLALQALATGWLATRLGLALPPAGWRPLLEGLATALVVLAGFGLPPVLALRRVPTLRVLRRDVDGGEARALGSGVFGIGALVALVAWRAGSMTMALTLLGGLAATLLALAVLALALVAGLRAVRGRLRGPWRYGLANVGRRAGASVVQISALGLGLLAVLLLTLVRTELLGEWQRALPASAPNRFIINVQADQVDAVRDTLRESGVDAVQLVPMVRGRLVAVNGVAVDFESFGDGRARRLAEREFNLSWTSELKADNRLVSGRWWGTVAPDDRAVAASANAATPVDAEVSVEERLAETLGWKLGDRIAWDIAGQRYEAAITSLRQVEWESFQPNFFVLARPGSLAGYAASWIGGMHVPAGSHATRNLVARFPNLSVIDIDAVLTQVRATSDQVSTAVEAVFGFTLAAGVLVLLAAVVATRDERLLEGGVMRALGASRAQLRWGQVAEFGAIGLVAGLVAAIAASALSMVIAREVFDLTPRLDWRVPLVGAVLGVACVVAFGLAATRRVISAPPADTLRAFGAG